MRTNLLLLLLICSVVSVQAKKKWAITTNGESLQALTQVTDNEEPCFFPFGGDNGKALYFAVRENKRWYNIYKNTSVHENLLTLSDVTL